MHKDINVNVSGPVQPTSTYKTKVLKGNLPFALQVTEPNMKYVIKHDFDLGGTTVQIPSGCILEFDGGSIVNGTLVGNNTILIHFQPLSEIMTVTLEGAWIDNIEDINDKIRNLEDAVGTGGSVDSRISAAVNAAKSEIKGNATSACDTLGEAEALISAEQTRSQVAEEQLRQAYEALSQSQPIPVTALPATGEAGKIYRQAGTTSYADYMYAEGALTTPIKMAEYDNAIDDEPTAGSDNLVKSGGAWKTPKFLFAENCPWIKEMYINQDGISAGLGNVHNVYSNHLTFSNTEADTFVGMTDTSENNGINKIYYFDGTFIDNKKILGYTIVDWAAIPSNQSDVNRINDIAKNIQYSPAIEADLIQKDLSVLQENTIGGDNASKDYSILPNRGKNLNANIFFQYPKNFKVKKINQIRYKILPGTVNFHKVTINGGIGTFQLIATDTNDSGDGNIKVLPISEQTLAENEYIGISGNFYFGVDANAQGFTGGNVDISTGTVTTGGVIALGFDAEYSDALSTKVKNLQDETKSINISFYGATEGDVISNYDNIVVLASDGTGDFTTFTDAHAFCSNETNKYKTTLVIMPGIYDIPVNTGSGYVICYNIKGVGNPILKSYNETGNVDIKTTFSPFMMDTNTPSFHQSVSIEGVTAIGKNVRYCVHDELGGLQNISYTHVFKNCKFVHLTAPDSEWAMPRCIGGGLGNNGLVIIDNCEFQSEIATSVDYHTGFDGGAESSKVIVKDSILANNTVSCTSTTYPSDLSVMVVKDCILHSEPIYTDEHNNQDFKLISKNNIIV